MVEYIEFNSIHPFIADIKCLYRTDRVVIFEIKISFIVVSCMGFTPF